MLEGLEIPGLSSLNTVAAYFLGSAIVILVVGLAVGITMWLTGRAKGGSNTASKGLTTSGIAVAGAIVLGGAGGAIQWGSGLGDSELMPTAAQPQDITIDKEPASVSCPAVTRDFSEDWKDRLEAASDGTALEDLNLDANEENFQWARELVGEEYADENAVNREDHYQLMGVSWHPDGEGGDCDVSNETAEQCSEVTFEYIPDEQDRNTIEIGGPECEDE